MPSKKTAAKKTAKPAAQPAGSGASSSFEERHARLAQLEQQISDERAAIASERDGHIKGVWDDFNQRLGAVGATVDDAHRVGGYRPSKTGTVSAKKAAKAVKSPVGTKAPVKFRNKETGQTWSGRGLEPRWLRGKNRADFAV